MSKGNYSHNSFKPENNYIGVRLQQGVPLLDSDWNELNDVIRHETYNVVDTLFSDGVVGADDLAVTKDAAGRLWLNAGAAVLSGRPVRVAARAEIPASLFAASFDGKTPEGIFLDVWEEEVAPEATHPSLNEVTCMRLRRRAWLCVGNPENGPAPELGHLYLPLAKLNRTVEMPLLKDAEVIDLRPRAHSRTGRTVTLSIPPIFLPDQVYLEHFPWSLETGIEYDGICFYSKKHRDESKKICLTSGRVVISLPDGVILRTFSAYVDVESDQSVHIELRRISFLPPTRSGIVLAGHRNFTKENKSITVAIDDQYKISDNNAGMYYIHACSDSLEEVKIRGFSITYEEI